jgi:hypothetical protein
MRVVASSEAIMDDQQDVTDFLVDQARLSEHVTALIRLLEGDDPALSGTNPVKST